MIKKHQIYKTDKWNMLTVEVNGRELILREISTEWGEETHKFISRPEMMQWASDRFKKEDFDTEAEWEAIMNAFREV